MIDTTLLWQAILLAQTHSVWGRFDHGRDANEPDYGLLIVGATALVALVAVVVNVLTRRTAKGFTSNSPGGLFRSLCRAHRLPRSHRNMLKRLAAANGLANPATLFVEPKYFAEPNLPQAMQAVARELHQLQRRLFG